VAQLVFADLLCRHPAMDGHGAIYGALVIQVGTDSDQLKMLR
jgi:hypothetical protein